jgi:hypothetical protein
MSKKPRFIRGVMLSGGVAFLQAGATVKFTGPAAMGAPLPPGGSNPAEDDVDRTDKHASGVVKVNAYGAERNISFALWGSNNYRPTDIIKEAKKSGILKAGLSTRRDAHYGAGPMYYRLEAQDDTEVVKPLGMSTIPPNIREFHRRAQLERVHQRFIQDTEWWGWYACEYLLNGAKSQITSYRGLRAAWVRWSLMDDAGRIQWCIFNPNWPLYKGGTVEVIPVADPWWTPEEVREWARENGYTKFVRPAMMPDPNEGYYPDKDWHALYDNQWLQNTNSIPASRAALLENSINLKYHIEIPSSYFSQKYHDSWGDMTDSERDGKRREMLEQMNTWLSGAANAGKAFVSEFAVDEEGKAQPGWKINVLDNKMGEATGGSIADSEKGNSEILATLRVDPTLLGQGAPGGKLGAGSGSDKAEAIRILHALMYGDREMTTEPYYFTRDFNGWDQSIYMGYRPMELQLQTTSAERPAANAS